MYVIKRDGRKESVHFDKITSRIEKLCYGLHPEHVDATVISQKVVPGLFPGVTTFELDELAAQTAASCATRHPDFSTLAARISISNLHKQTSSDFSDVIDQLYHHIHPKTGQHSPLVSEELYNIVMNNKDVLNNAIKYERDYSYDYFGFKTLERAYLISINKKVIERPQHMIMRVAIGIHGSNIENVLESYDLMSQQYFTHATPTLYNSGTCHPQLSSCFLLTMKSDSIDGIYDTLKQCAIISKYAGGIGLSIHNIRGSNSYIRGTNGSSNGIVPMLRVFNNTARYVDQGGGKRKGSIAIYLEPWHCDIFSFLELKKNHGNENERARDLFYSLWIPDLFMKRVESNGTWSLFCPNECPGLSEVYGEEFEKLYDTYEKSGKARRTFPAQELWVAILNSQVETGTPFICYKDSCNRKSNQKNLGTIKSSNLCTEIVQYTSPEECAVCNLASISLSAFVKYSGLPEKKVDPNDEAEKNIFSYQSPASIHSPIEGTPYFDFDLLFKITKVIVKNLNRVIDVNFYPIPEAKNSNLKHRPIGIGVQGLADMFAKMRLPFDSEEAAKLNKEVFETIYYSALESSCDLAQAQGPYESYPGSPISQGIFQFDLWNVPASSLSGRWDWEALRSKILQHGVRNSLLLAPMPTASTAQILGNNESIEPFTSNMYNRRVLAGEFTIVNKYLLRELIERNLWNNEIRNQIIAERGSIQNISAIPQSIKNLYKTVWEIKQKVIIDQAADRGIFICQSQSLNIHMAEPTIAKLTSMHFYSWKKGLKTGMYYLRTLPKADAIQFTVDQNLLNKSKNTTSTTSTKDDEDDGVCHNCSA